VKKSADQPVADRLLLPDDSAAYVKWAESADIRKPFAQ
jgi:hypothetical protein